ncbi:threonine ammonia-lyase [Desulfonema magnum]|uniref:threonine ammonia-lyase n=1 Tax=Desulfonema magnum TaxID=45655 RepID=UPI001A9C0F1D|nr:threonine ammonia-lyase [Desulfonema magnum]
MEKTSWGKGTQMITIDTIQQAATIIKGRVIRTPLVHSPTFSRMFGGEIYLKLENLQKTGAFKIRGATHKLLKHLKKIGSGGVVAASAGNHAQGVALAAKQAGIASTIVMPEWASISKQEATRGYGGKVVIAGQSVAESLSKAQELAGKGKTFVHPFDDADIIAGQGSIALEILEDLKHADIILVPIGGGGLISGIAVAAKTIRPDIKVIGVQAAVCPSAFESCRQGKVTKVESEALSIADGITVKQTGELTFKIIRKYVDEVVLVEEQHIAAAILMLLERKKVLAEGAGAVTLAALLSRTIVIPSGKKAVLLISGGNLDSPLLGRIIGKGLVTHGRIMRLRVHLSDTPGSLSRLLDQVAYLKANVLHIYHDRNVKDIPINISCVEIELETRSSAHIDHICGELQKAGYEMELK